RAPILLLDEPTAGLDAHSADSVMQAVQASTLDRTVLLITHDRDLAAIADRVVTLSRSEEPVPALGRA
ncbi:MAG TPA: ABC transporter ATP-binding protein, partial [Pseudonocardiaceae bacterium]